MKKTEELLRKEYGKSILAFLLSLLFVAAVFWKAGIFFETNDDRCIAEILSGRLTPAPDGHTVYMNYLLGWPLARLYAWKGGIPWYGAFLILLHVVAYYEWLAGLFAHCDTRGTFLAAVCLGCSMLVGNLYLLGELQYTSTAALLAGMGYVCLFLHREDTKGFRAFLILELLAFLLRSQAMLMMQPLGAAMWLGSLLAGGQKQDKRECWLKFLRRIGCLAVTLVFAMLVQVFAYGGQDWQMYDRLKEAETTLFDYCGAPSYEEAKPILDPYGVTEAEYTAFRNYVILDWDVPVECLEELAAYAEAEQAAEKPSAERLLTAWKDGLRGNYQDSNRLTMTLWGISLLWILIWKRRKLVLPLLSLGMARLLLWSYLLYRGRLPLRLSVPLLACETLLLTALLWKDFLEADRVSLFSGRKRVAAAGFCVILLAACFTVGRSQYRYVCRENQGQQIYMEGLREIQAYCDQRPNEKFLWDALSFCYYKGSALETETYGPCNGVATGSWFSGSPPIRRKLAEYLGTDVDSLSLIVYDSGSTRGHPAVRYLEEKLQVSPVPGDTIHASNGVTYVVWEFERKLEDR